MTTKKRVFDFDLTKSGCEELLKALGYTGKAKGQDWNRVSKADMIAMLKKHTYAELIKVALEIWDTTEEEMSIEVEVDENGNAQQDEQQEQAASADDEGKAYRTHDHETTESEVETMTAMNKAISDAGKEMSVQAPDVMEVATVLAQILRANRASVSRDEVMAMVKEAVESLPPRTIVVKSEFATIKVEGKQHKLFETLLATCTVRNYEGHMLNVWLAGPAGSGKTTACKNVAKALDRPFYCNGALTSEFKLTGFIDAGGTYHTTPFREAWEKGGVYLYDEIDGSDPKILTAFNAALANGVMAFPDGMVTRHQDCVILAAANTFGLGATTEYVGRSKQDAASLDRFVMLFWDIDEDLELELSANREWCRYVQKLRAKATVKGLKVLITPRATQFGEVLLATKKMDRETVINMTVKKGMSEDQWKALND